MEKEIFFDLNLEEEEMDFGDDVILRVVEDGAIAREKDNDEKDECAIIIVVVFVVVAIFVLLFSLSFPCVFLGEKKWRRREKDFIEIPSTMIKTSRKVQRAGVQFPRHVFFLPPFRDFEHPLSLSLFCWGLVFLPPDVEKKGPPPPRSKKTKKRKIIC